MVEEECAITGEVRRREVDQFLQEQEDSFFEGGGGEDVENLFLFSKFLITIFLVLSPLRAFLYSRAARVVPQISHSHQRTLTLILEN